MTLPLDETGGEVQSQDMTSNNQILDEMTVGLLNAQITLVAALREIDALRIDLLQADVRRMQADR